MAENKKKPANKPTKAGLMSKHADEIDADEAAANDAANDAESGGAAAKLENLPKAGKHESEGSRKSEGLH